MTGANTGNGPGPDEPLDVVVIGGGQAGLAVAWHLAPAGTAVRGAGGRRPARAARGAAAGTRCGCSALLSTTPCPAWPFPAPADTYPGKEAVADFLRDYAASVRPAGAS